MDLILADLAAGVIDEPTSVLYRVYSIFGDDRLPEPYRGSAEEDSAALDIASTEIDTYPAEIADQLRPWLLRPTDPNSYWAPAATAISARPLAARARGEGASACVNGWITGAPVKAAAIVWAQCGFSIPEAVSLQRVNEGVADIDALWEPMTTLMGLPVGDRSAPGDASEKNDGKLDIYIVDYATTLHGRGLDPGANRGVTPRATPTGAPGRPFASSTYIVINGPVTGGGPELKDAIAHEFFHSLESAHNRTATVIGNSSFWMFEASAVWAEHQFVPENRYNEYGYFGDFQATNLSLSDNSGKNAYYSWIWPMFMAQEKGPASVAAVWSAMETKSGFPDLQATVDNALPFQNRFRDFAVRVWNEKLLPNDPINPDFQDWAGDFPGKTPPTKRLLDQYTVPAEDLGAAPHEFPTTLASLWAGYVKLDIDPMVKQLVVDYSGLTPSAALDVDGLLKIKDKGWERRKLTTGETRFCLTDAADHVEQAIVVLSNHAKDPATSVTGKWTVKGLAQACADLHGTLTYTRTSVYNSGPGVPLWTRDEQMTATITVDMKSDPDPLGGGGYIDNHSSYSISRTTLDRRQMGNCTASYGTKTSGSWAFADQPVGPDWVNNITGYVDYESGIAQLAVVVHYPYEATEDVCNLLGGPNEGVHDFFACTGADGLGGGLTGKLTEVDGGPDTITFNCRQQGPAMDYTQQTVSVTGTLTLEDEAASPSP